MSKNPPSTSSLLIRRLIALLLSALAVLGLFLPMVSISLKARSAFRRVKTDTSDSCKAFIEDLPSYVVQILKEGEAERKYIDITEDLVSDLVRGVALPLYNLGADRRITLLELCEAVGLPAKAVDVLSAHQDEIDALLAEFGGSNPAYKDQEEDIREALIAVASIGTGFRIASIVLYVLFGITVLLGVLSFVMELLNRGKTFPVLFCVVALLTAALFAAAVIAPRFITGDIEPILFDLEAEELGANLSQLANAIVLAVTTLAPGAGLFLLPIGALAGCILYKRDTSYAGVLPQRPKKAVPAADVKPFRNEAVRPAPQPASPANAPATPVHPYRNQVARPAPQPAQPVYAPAAPAPAQPSRNQVARPAPQSAQPVFAPAAPVQGGSWTCVICGQKNEPTANFCCRCGSCKPQPPAPATEPKPAIRFCPVCGHELASGHLFCPGCGTRLSQDA